MTKKSRGEIHINHFSGKKVEGNLKGNQAFKIYVNEKTKNGDLGI